MTPTTLLRRVLKRALTTAASSRAISQAVFGRPNQKSKVQNWKNRALELKLTWPIVAGMTEAELRKIFWRPGNPGRLNAKPDFEEIKEALQHPGMSLWTYWDEARGANPENTLSYSRLAAHCAANRKKSRRTMRQNLLPGEKAFVDYSGKRPWFFNEQGEKVEVEMFVGALGRSGLVFAWCSLTQRSHDFVEANTRMLEAYGGAPAVIVCDNLRAGVSRAGRDPVIHPAYLEMAEWYQSAVHPAPPYKPKAKAIVEGSVRLMQLAFLPLLRHNPCSSLDEVNTLLAKRVQQVNAKRFQKKPSSRQEVFDRVDKPALTPLPAQRFEYVEFSAPVQVPSDYHVKVGGHFYSVPHEWVGYPVYPRSTVGEVILERDDHPPVRHPRSTEEAGQTTERAHMPAAHQALLDRTPAQLLAWAETIGPNTHSLMQKQFERKVPLQGLLKADAIKSTARAAKPEAIEAAAQRALALHSPTPSTFQRLLVSVPKEVEAPGGFGAAPVGLPLVPRSRATPHRGAKRKSVPRSTAATPTGLPVAPAVSRSRRSSRSSARRSS
jgi:transposase